MRTKSRRSRAGLSLAEVLVSCALISLVLIGAMNCVAGLVRGGTSVADEALARKLAAQLTAEILDQAYLDPNDPPVFGPELTEISGLRTDFDDVDDYHGWTANPPQDRTGSPLPGLNGWQRDVLVKWVTPADPSINSASDQGVKRITVTVLKDGVILAQLVSLRSEGY